jgi:hypothetical protein
MHEKLSIWCWFREILNFYKWVLTGIPEMNGRAMLYSKNGNVYVYINQCLPTAVTVGSKNVMQTLLIFCCNGMKRPCITIRNKQKYYLEGFKWETLSLIILLATYNLGWTLALKIDLIVFITEAPSVPTSLSLCNKYNWNWNFNLGFIYW